MTRPPRRRPPGLLDSALIVARSWVGAALIAALAVVGTGSCRLDAPPLAESATSSPGHLHTSPRGVTTLE
jgi:hypothetical protein